jgi:hypothetical protein
VFGIGHVHVIFVFIENQILGRFIKYFNLIAGKIIDRNVLQNENDNDESQYKEYKGRVVLKIKKGEDAVQDPVGVDLFGINDHVDDRKQRRQTQNLDNG